MRNSTEPPSVPPSLFQPAERAFLKAVSRLAFANPFLPERLDAERAALAGDFEDPGPAWSPGLPDPNLPRIQRLLRPLLASARARLAALASAGAGAGASAADLTLYEDGCLHLLLDTHAARFHQLRAAGSPGLAAHYRAFLAEHEHLLRLPGIALDPPPPEILFACGWQMARALHQISSTLLGGSRPASALRAAVWRAIFTWDLRDYLADPEGAMNDISTVITGPSGSGKELVAAAIARSTFIPFDPGAGRFVADPEAQFSALNLAALPATLIESALFGHIRGAFTSADRDQAGWLESCGRFGVVFLDEIGELDPALQPKLLRVLESRTFQRLGATETLHFQGRILSATHRDLAERIAAGAFRLDLYQRLRSCSIRTPSLREQLDDAPDERRRLVRFIAGKVRARKAEALTDRVESWLDTALRGYPWPGNVRELWQCVRDVYATGEFHPERLPGTQPKKDGEDPVESLRACRLSGSEALDRYATMVQAHTGNLSETARVLGIHRHTVAKRIDYALLARLTGHAEGGGVEKAPPERRERKVRRSAKSLTATSPNGAGAPAQTDAPSERGTSRSGSTVQRPRRSR